MGLDGDHSSVEKPMGLSVASVISNITDTNNNSTIKSREPGENESMPSSRLSYCGPSLGSTPTPPSWEGNSSLESSSSGNFNHRLDILHLFGSSTSLGSAMTV